MFCRKPKVPEVSMEVVMERRDGGSQNRMDGGQKLEMSCCLSTEGCRISTSMWQCRIGVSKSDVVM
jgi:hypothetical protein